MFDTFRSFPKACILSKIDLTAKSIDNASYILNKYGLVVIPREIIYSNFEQVFCKSMRKSVEQLYLLFSDSNFIDNMSYKVEYDTLKSDHPAKLARRKNSFFSIRDKIFFDRKNNEWRNIDGGLFDFFNPDKKIFQNNIINYINLTAKRSIDVIQSIKKDLKFEIPYQNLYIYKNVKDPRCLHSDTHKIQFNSFISFTDIDTVDCGPISYVPYSHKKIGKIRSLISSIISTYFYSDIGKGKYDAVLFGKQESIPITTRFLDVIIGNQSCVHGDLPYKLDNKIQKMIFVNNIFPKKE